MENNMNELDFAPYLFSNFEEVGKQLKDEPSKIIGFINFLFDLIEKKVPLSVGVFNIPKIDIRVLLTWCTWILVCGEEPNEYLNNLKANSKTKVCTKVWNDGYYFYRCRDCEKTPSSSICAECFRDGNHEGHNFIFERSFYGGCCDCGNPYAWKPEGYCPNHKGMNSIDSSTLLPKEVSRNAHIVIQTLFKRLKPYLPYEEKRDISSTESEIITAAIAWVRYIGSFTEALIQIIREEMINDFMEPHFLDIVLYSCLSLKGELLDEFLFFLLDVLQDPDFKGIFLEVYLKIYPSLIQNMKEYRPEVVYKISPQLFSIPTLTRPICMKKGGFLDVMLENLLDLFQQFSIVDPVTGLKLIDCESKYLDPQNYYAFTNDLNTLLGDPEIAKYILFEREDLFMLLLQVLSLVQMSNPIVRKVDVHTEYESDTWQSAFSLEMETTRSINSVVQGFEKNVQRMKKIICIISRMVYEHAKKLIHEEVEINEFHTFKYQVSTQPVSFHIPLHRALARCIGDAFQFQPDIKLTDLLSVNLFSQDYTAVLIEQPLHLHVLFPQVRADLWIRNGLSIINQAYIYRGSYLMEFYQADLLLIQCGLVLLGPSHFFKTALLRFELFEWFKIYESSSVPENKEIGIADDFLKFLITVITDRNRIGAPEAEIVRREIIHLLALGDLAHSKLLNELHHQISESPFFENILKDIADYRAPTPGAPGTFHLKSSAWKEFDPYFPRWDPQNQQIAMENYASRRPKEQSSLQMKPLEFKEFNALVSLLHVKDLHYCLYIIFSNALLHPPSFDSILRTALHLTLMILDNPPKKQSEEDKEGDSDLMTYARQEQPTGPSILVQLISLFKDSKFQEFHDYLLPILKRLNMDGSNKVIINDYLPGFGVDQSQGQESEAELKRKAAKERQAAIMARFAMQQKAFLESSSMDENKEEEKESEPTNDYDTISTGLLCALCRSEAPPAEGRVLGLIALLETSRVLPIAKNQDIGLLQTAWPSNSTDKMEPKLPNFALSTSPVVSPVVVQVTTMEEETPPSGSPATKSLKDEEEEEEEKKEEKRYQSSDDKTAVSIHYCGHCMHDDCFNSFFTSLLQRHLQNILYQRIQNNNVEKGEFFCPICRRLSNALIPIVSDDLMKQIQLPKIIEPEDFDKWIESQLYNIPGEDMETEKNFNTQIESIDKEIGSLATRIHCSQENLLYLETITKPKDSNEVMWSFWESFSSNVEIAELLGRHNLDISKNLDCLQKLWKCIKLRTIIFGNHKALTFTLHSLLGSSCLEKSYVPMLVTNIFDVLIKLVILWPHELEKTTIRNLMRLHYAAKVMQCFAFFSQNGILDYSIEEKNDFNSSLYQTLQQVWAAFNNYGIPNVSIEKLEEMIKPLCLPFLRRLSILLHLLDAANTSTFQFPNSFEELIKYLELPSLQDLFNSFQLQKLVFAWCKQYQEVEGQFSIPKLGPPVPTRLIDLPNTFQELILRFVGLKCNNCGTAPKQGAVCLICGQLCCVASQCCYKNGKGECARHADACGGIFIMLKSTYVLILRGERRTAWGSLYLDEHGEEDIGLRRGRSLYLSIIRYNELQNMWLESSFDYNSKILASTVQDGYFM